jgi:uncharacterized protein
MRAVLLSGGLTHDFPATTACLADLLVRGGIRPEVHEDVDAALRALPGAALFVVNALRWTMTGPGTPDRYRAMAPEHGVSPAVRDALGTHLASGGGLLGMHTAAICFDDWPEWAAALGWPHPIVEGIDGFPIVDEVYGDLDRPPDTVALLRAAQPGSDGPAQPLLWAREHGGGRVVYDALGHHPPSYEVSEHREIVRRVIAWTTGG